VLLARSSLLNSCSGVVLCSVRVLVDLLLLFSTGATVYLNSTDRIDRMSFVLCHTHNLSINKTRVVRKYSTKQS
jgi:hypothetical protein